MLVVSRAGTMFDGDLKPWVLIREALLSALERVEASAELGFLAVTGAHEACPVLVEVAPAASNYTAIASTYNALEDLLPKGESPFMYGFDRAAELLTGPGKKYVVFVLNGEADYCSDGSPACPTDSVIARIQKLHAAGITTLIASAPAPFAIDEQRLAAYESAIQGYANAGAGLPTTSHDDPNTLNIMCSAASDAGAEAWRAELESSGKPDTATLAAYAAVAGDASHVRLDLQSVSDLSSAFRTLLEGIARCD